MMDLQYSLIQEKLLEKLEVLSEQKTKLKQQISDAKSRKNAHLIPSLTRGLDKARSQVQDVVNDQIMLHNSRLALESLATTYLGDEKAQQTLLASHPCKCNAGSRDQKPAGTAAPVDERESVKETVVQPPLFCVFGL